jgi:hypothetical protein
MTEKIFNRISLFTALAMCVIATIVAARFYASAGNKEKQEYTRSQFVDPTYDKLFVQFDSGKHDYYRQEKHDDELSFQESELVLDSTDFKQLLDKLIEKRSDNYRKNLEELHELIQLLVAFLILAVLIIFYDPAQVNLPVVNIAIPNRLFHPSIAIGLVYMWMQFGLFMNASIDDRLALTHLIRHVETFDNHHVSYAYSALNNMVDMGLIDIWSHWFYKLFGNSHHNEMHDFLAGCGLFVIYSFFWAMIHATTLILISILYRKTSEKGQSWLVLVLFFIAMILFVMSNFAFLFEFKHSGYLMATMWGMVALIIFVWMRYGKSYVKERKASSSMA